MFFSPGVPHFWFNLSYFYGGNIFFVIYSKTCIEIWMCKVMCNIFLTVYFVVTNSLMMCFQIVVVCSFNAHWLFHQFCWCCFIFTWCLELYDILMHTFFQSETDFIFLVEVLVQCFFQNIYPCFIYFFFNLCWFFLFAQACPFGLATNWHLIFSCLRIKFDVGLWINYPVI